MSRRYQARGSVDATAVPAPTEIPQNAQAPRRYGPSYYGGESDIRKEGANWLRALMGQTQMEPTGALPEPTLLSEETVDVTAPRDPMLPPPPRMDSLYLGTETEPPAATYTPPPGAPPHIDADPGVQELWARVMKQYPYAARSVRSVRLDPTLSGDGAAGVHDNGRISLDPVYGINPGTLTHELTHAAQRQQFPDSRRAWRAYEGTPWAPYDERPGEQIARMVTRAYDEEPDVRPHYLARLRALLAQHPTYPK